MSLSCFEEVEVERLRKKSDGGGHRFVEVSENVGPVFVFSLPIFSPSALSAEDRARYPLEDAVAASLSLSLSLKRTHRDFFLRDDGDGISAPDADGRVARGLCGLEGVFCRWFVNFFARISRESVSESTSRRRPRSRRESRLRGAEGGKRDSDGRRDRFSVTIDPSLDRPPPPSFFPPLSASPALFSTASTCLRRRTDLVEPAVRGKDRDVAVVAAARAARHGCKKSKRGDRERKRRRRRCPLASSFLR